MNRTRNRCPDCGAILDPGERCNCEGAGFVNTSVRDRLRAIQAAEQRNQQRIGEFTDRQKQRNMNDFLYK